MTGRAAQPAPYQGRRSFPSPTSACSASRWPYSLSWADRAQAMSSWERRRAPGSLARWLSLR